MRSSRLTALALVCLLGLTGLTAVAGAPPPTQLCGTCHSDIPGATGAGTLDVYVDADGDSEWVERVPVNDTAADRYRDDPDALEQTVDDAWNDSYRILVEQSDEEIDRDETIENGTVTVTYAVDGVARSGVGESLILDYFALDRGAHRYGLVAERVTVHAPDDTVVTNEPLGASVAENTATWTADSDFSERVYVTFGSSGIVGTATGYATVGHEVVPGALETGAFVGPVPGLVLGLAGVVAGRVDWGRDAVDTAALERLLGLSGAVIAGGFLAISVSVAGPDPSVHPGPLALCTLGVGYGSVAVAARRRGIGLGTRGLTALAALATFATGAAMTILVGPSAFVAVLPFGLATALFLPIGYAAERGTLPVGLVAVAAGAPVVAFTVLPLTGTLPWIAVAAALGYPLALLGWQFFSGGADRDSTIGARFLLAPLAVIAAAAGWVALGEFWFGVLLYWFLLWLVAIPVAVFGYPLALLGRQLVAEE